MTLILTLNGHRFRLSGITHKMLPSNTLLFCKDDDGGDVEFCYEYHFVDKLPVEPSFGWQPVYQKPNIMVWRNGSLERRCIMTNGVSSSYAIYEETSATHADIWFASALRDELVIDTMFVSTL